MQATLQKIAKERGVLTFTGVLLWYSDMASAFIQSENKGDVIIFHIHSHTSFWGGVVFGPVNVLSRDVYHCFVKDWAHLLNWKQSRKTSRSYPEYTPVLFRANTLGEHRRKYCCCAQCRILLVDARWHALSKGQTSQLLLPKLVRQHPSLTSAALRTSRKGRRRKERGGFKKQQH